jgi:hypothetical protein
VCSVLGPDRKAVDAFFDGNNRKDIRSDIGQSHEQQAQNVSAQVDAETSIVPVYNEEVDSVDVMNDVQHADHSMDMTRVMMS